MIWRSINYLQSVLQIITHVRLIARFRARNMNNTQKMRLQCYTCKTFLFDKWRYHVIRGAAWLCLIFSTILNDVTQSGMMIWGSLITREVWKKTISNFKSALCLSIAWNNYVLGHLQAQRWPNLDSAHIRELHLEWYFSGVYSSNCSYHNVTKLHLPITPYTFQ